MSRIAKQSARVVLVAFVAVAISPALSSGQGGPSALMPPNANFQGGSLEEWNVLASEYAIATGLTGQELPDTVGHVRFLPYYGATEFSIELDPGTAIALPAFFFFGERYVDGTTDDVNDPIVDTIFETAIVETRLNGRVLLQGIASELETYRFGPVYFDPPIWYSEPQPRGPFPDAVAAAVVLGVGSVYRPLPVGEHTLEITVDSGFFGLIERTYHISVTPSGRRR
jgi:hypothetical protein